MTKRGTTYIHRRQRWGQVPSVYLFMHLVRHSPSVHQIQIQSELLAWSHLLIAHSVFGPIKAQVFCERFSHIIYYWTLTESPQFPVQINAYHCYLYFLSCPASPSPSPTKLSVLFTDWFSTSLSSCLPFSLHFSESHANELTPEEITEVGDIYWKCKCQYLNNKNQNLIAKTCWQLCNLVFSWGMSTCLHTRVCFIGVENVVGQIWNISSFI